MNKLTVHKAISINLQERIDSLTSILKETYEATANESKISAGDKHETAISMAQLEQEKLTKQINEFLELKASLLKINPNREHTIIEPGSLVETNNGWYYFSIGLGAVTIEGKSIFAMNPLAPIGQLMLGIKAGDKIEFNGRMTEIVSVY